MPAPPGRFRTALRPWLRAVADLVCPVFCPSCEVPQPGSEPDQLCEACTKKSEPVEFPFCQICAEPFAGVIAGPFSCPNCAGREFAFDFAVCAWMSSGPVREMVHDFKYGRRRSLRAVLGRLMLRGLDDERILDEPDWLLVPVPLHRRRKRERGFNQSLELAEVVASHSALKVADQLVRTRYTTMQASLSRKERLSNMSGAFRLTRRALKRGIFKDRAVLLVDDVFTTGSTAHECASILKRDGGARKVAAFTVARG